MLPTLTGILNLAIGLWWLWLILIGSIFFLLRPVFLKSLVIGGMLVVIGTMYLVLSPLERLQIALPAYAAAPLSPQFGPNGAPVANTFELNLLPGLYDAVNYFFIPLLKQHWAIWIPGWFLILAVEVFTPKPRRVRR